MRISEQDKKTLYDRFKIKAIALNNERIYPIKY